MRAAVLAFVLGLALAVSARAAPLAPNSLSPVLYLPNQQWVPLSNGPSSLAPVEAPPPIELVAQDCGWGWHRVHWQDRWGYWHWGHCVPYGHVHHWRGTRLEHPCADWRGPSGGWGNP